MLDADHYRELLLGRRALLVRALKPEIVDVETDPRDEADQAEETQASDLLARLDELTSRRVVAIDRALERIDRGEYGDCIDCGQPIERERLELVPWAARCADDERAYETERATHAPTL
jgi:RNA polymerase-binding transcription factor DksA